MPKPDWTALIGETVIQINKLFKSVSNATDKTVRQVIEKTTGIRTDDKERRVFPRTMVSIPVLAMLSDRAIDTKIFEISDGGLKVLTPRRVRKGERITLRIHEQVEDTRATTKINPVETVATTKAGDLMAELDNFKTKLNAAKTATPAKKTAEEIAKAFDEDGAPPPRPNVEETFVPKVATLNPEWMQTGDRGDLSKEKIIKVYKDSPVMVINVELEAVWCTTRAGTGEFNVGARFCEEQSQAMRKWKRDLLFTIEIAETAKDKAAVQLTDKPMTVGQDPRAGKEAPKYTKVKKSVAEGAANLEVVDKRKQIEKARLEDDGSWMQVKRDYRKPPTDTPS